MILEARRGVTAPRCAPPPANRPSPPPRPFTNRIAVAAFGGEAPSGRRLPPRAIQGIAAVQRRGRAPLEQEGARAPAISRRSPEPAVHGAGLTSTVEERPEAEEQRLDQRLRVPVPPAAMRNTVAESARARARAIVSRAAGFVQPTERSGRSHRRGNPPGSARPIPEQAAPERVHGECPLRRASVRRPRPPTAA